MNEFDLVKEFVRYFGHEEYDIAIKNVKEGLAGENENYNQWVQENWPRLVSLVRDRRMASGQPIVLSQMASVLLYENTDEEAYEWLDLLVYNVERIDGQIDDYYDTFPQKDNRRKHNKPVR